MKTLRRRLAEVQPYSIEGFYRHRRLVFEDISEYRHSLDPVQLRQVCWMVCDAVEFDEKPV